MNCISLRVVSGLIAFGSNSESMHIDFEMLQSSVLASKGIGFQLSKKMKLLMWRLRFSTLGPSTVCWNIVSVSIFGPLREPFWNMLAPNMARNDWEKH